MSAATDTPQNDQIQPARTRKVQDLRHDSPFLSCRFDPSGRFVFAGAEDSSIQRWELANNRKTALTGHQSWIRALDFVPARQQLISGDYHGKLIWWQADADNPQPLRTIEAHEGWVRAVAVSPNGELAASCGNDQLVKIWSSSDGRLIRTLRGHDCHVYNVAFHPEGRFLVSADHHGVVKQWDHAEGREVRSFDAGALHHYDNTFRAIIGGIRSLAFNADGTRLACAGITNVTNAFAGIGNPAVVLFDWQTGQRRHILRVQGASRGTAWGIHFHPSGLLIGTGGGSGGELWFWRDGQEQSFATVRLPNSSRDLDLHSDGHRLAIAFHDRLVRIFDMVPA